MIQYGIFQQRQFIAASQGRKINSVQRTRQLLIFYKKLTLSELPKLWIKIHICNKNV